MIQQIAPPDLRRHWPVIRKYVNRACATGDYAFLPEDVYTSAIGGNALVYLLKTEAGVTCGAMIFTLRDTFGRKELYGWVLAHDDPDKGMDVFTGFVTDLAKSLNCERWCFDSPRAFHKVIPGLKLESHHFYMEINNAG